MQNQPDLSGLVDEASKKLGISPKELQRQLENGTLDNIMKKLPQQQAQNFQQILNNPELAKKMMQSPQVQQMMKHFMKQK